ncbi:centrosomal protein of 152 kDa isoform X3 [Stigmatopora nigra]
MTRAVSKASATMSLDFDVGALQIQEDYELHDQNDIEREQELRQLIAELPDDDLLVDSRESSYTEQESSPFGHKNVTTSPQSKTNQQGSDHPRPASKDQNYEEDYVQLPRGFAQQNGGGQINGHQRHAQTQLWAQICNQQSPDKLFTQEDYTRTSMGSEKYTEYSDQAPGPQNFLNYEEEEGLANGYDNGNQKNPRVHFHSGAVERHGNNPVSPRKKLSSRPAQEDYPYDQLQREFLDSTQQTAEMEELAQQRTLNRARQNKIVDLEQKLEDSKRNIRYLEHQFEIIKKEKASSDTNIKDLSRLLDEAKTREINMENKVKADEQIIQTLKECDRQKTEELNVSKAVEDSLRQQISELRHSQTLSKPREQHDRDITVIRQQHEAALLVLQQQLDAKSQALDVQVDCNKRYEEQVNKLERQREEAYQRLQESQQYYKLLQSNSAQETHKLQIQLSQVQKAKENHENMNKILKEDFDQLKEEISRYESALNHSGIPLEVNGDCENQLTESCLDLGLKKTTLKNGSLHRKALANLPNSNLPKDDALLREEMQRCLMCLTAKRQKVNKLQEQLQRSQARVKELETKLDQAQSNLNKHPDQNELAKLQEKTRLSQDEVERLKRELQERQQTEEDLQSNYDQICFKMRHMQETAKISKQMNQQQMADVVNQVKSELLLNHNTQVEHLTARYEQHIQQLSIQLSEAKSEISDVQEHYILMCKEKDMLENKQKKREESNDDLEKLRTELEAQHQASVTQLKYLWSKEKEDEIQRRVASAKAAWQEEHHQTWSLKPKEARQEIHQETSEGTSQTNETNLDLMTITAEDLNARLSTQRMQLQMEAAKLQQRAVEEARKEVLKETQEKHLEDLSDKVEDAVTRAYDRWIEDMTSLPEYQASLRREREKWEELQKLSVEGKVRQPLTRVEEDGRGQNCATVEELQTKLVTLRSQLEQLKREQDALLKAEIAGARAAWRRDKQKEISALQTRGEELYQSKLQEQREKLQADLLAARDAADVQKTHLRQQMEADLRQTMAAREDEWKRQQAEREQSQRRQMREDFLAELQAGLAEVKTLLLGNPGTVDGDGDRMSEGAVTHLIQSCCVDIADRAVSQAKKDWKKISQAQLSCVLRETQQRHEREIQEMQTQVGGQACSKKECVDIASKLQMNNQKLQKRLEKACRHLQRSVLEHKKTVQNLKDEHEGRLQAKEEHLLQIQERALNLQRDLEKMHQDYMKTVSKIRENVRRYLQESIDRAAEFIWTEVQREKQNTARQMRHFYLACLQELLEEGGKTTGAEKIIMNAASKLATMARVLETPMKNQSGQNDALPTPKSVASTTGPSLTSHDTNCLRTQALDVVTVDGKPTLERTKTSAEAQIYPQKVATTLTRKEELPVRDDKWADWSLTSSDSEILQLPRASSLGRKVESVKPFYVSATDFGGLCPNTYELTVYNDSAQETKTPKETLAPKAQPHKEGDHRGMALLELKQQDSGFDSPFYQATCS